MPVVAFEALIHPPHALKTEKVWLAIADEAQRIADDIEKDFQRTTGTWEHKPVFDKEIEVGPTAAEILVGTDDEIYVYVCAGTDGGYPITPRGPYPLSFKVGGKPKTRPNTLRSFSRVEGHTQVYTKRVMHPGIEARNFDKLIQEKHDKSFSRRIQKALDRGIKDAGW